MKRINREKEIKKITIVIHNAKKNIDETITEEDKYNCKFYTKTSSIFFKDFISIYTNTLNSIINQADINNKTVDIFDQCICLAYAIKKHNTYTLTAKTNIIPEHLKNLNEKLIIEAIIEYLRYSEHNIKQTNIQFDTINIKEKNLEEYTKLKSEIELLLIENTSYENIKNKIKELYATALTYEIGLDKEDIPLITNKLKIRTKYEKNKSQEKNITLKKANV